MEIKHNFSMLHYPTIDHAAKNMPGKYKYNTFKIIIVTILNLVNVKLYLFPIKQHLIDCWTRKQQLNPFLKKNINCKLQFPPAEKHPLLYTPKKVINIYFVNNRKDNTHKNKYLRLFFNIEKRLPICQLYEREYVLDSTCDKKEINT